MRAYRTAGLVVAVAASFAAAALFLPHSPEALRQLIVGVGIVAPLLLIVGWALLTPALFPGTVLAAAGGLSFGALAGAALSLGGAVLGGLVAFALARTIARGPAERLLARSDKLERLNRLLEDRGFTAVLAARLMPGVPAGGLHYAAGVSKVRPVAFAGAIATGALLRTVPYALLGVGIGSGSPEVLGIAAASIVVGGVTALVLVRRLRPTAA